MVVYSLQPRFGASHWELCVAVQLDSDGGSPYLPWQSFGAS